MITCIQNFNRKP